MFYTETANALTQRIVALGPRILDLTDAWQLFEVDGSKCDDLAPSMAQADYALSAAKSILKRNAATTS